MSLTGEQLSMLSEVAPYLIENPPLPGEAMMTRSGKATVTRLESIGNEVVVWADYGSGIEHPHSRDRATCDLNIVLGGELCSQSLSPDPLVSPVESRACGWIGWKTTKRERKHRDPWTCRQAWLYWEEPGGKKRSRYIPKAKLEDVEHSVYGLKRSITETLELLNP